MCENNTHLDSKGTESPYYIIQRDLLRSFGHDNNNTVSVVSMNTSDLGPANRQPPKCQMLPMLPDNKGEQVEAGVSIVVRDFMFTNEIGTSVNW